MTRWYVTGATPKDAPDEPPKLNSARNFATAHEAWTFADEIQRITDGAGDRTTWAVYSLRPVGRVTVREQGGQP